MLAKVIGGHLTFTPHRILPLSATTTADIAPKRSSTHPALYLKITLFCTRKESGYFVSDYDMKCNK
uniref:Uncharacterized protein n=1 Tax=Lutzomyia longipalpis TaxID=7200 RepID=A0A1B0CNS0_LUTLO